MRSLLPSALQKPQTECRGRTYGWRASRIDFLINVNLGGYNVDLGKRVIVIGGGNVAMDVAVRRTHRDPGRRRHRDRARSRRAAMRMGATKEVHCLVVEDRSEMLADPYEVGEAEEEGVVIYNHFAPERIVGGNGKAIGVETLNVAVRSTIKGALTPS